MDGINIVEFAGWDNELEGGRMKALTDSLDKDLGASGNTRGIIGYQTCTELKDILAVYFLLSSDALVDAYSFSMKL